VAANLSVEVPTGWLVDPMAVDLSFETYGDSRMLRFDVKVPAEVRGVHELRYHMTVGSLRDSVVLHPVRQLAPGLPGPATEASCVSEVFLAHPATVAIHGIAAQFIRTLRIGYVEGTSEGLLPALARFDLDIEVISDDGLAFGDLSTYDTIVVGPNAYVLRPSVVRNSARLLDYIAQGGTLIVQYQSYDYDQMGAAPYPFTYSQPHDRVTQPDAPVTLLAPDHPILRTPNLITSEDFRGWVHDRGLYFFGEWDDRYSPLLASADPGEEAREGGLVVASHGRGTYVYAAYSFFRQIPAGLEGPIRLFANCLGYADAKVRERAARLRTVPIFDLLDEEELYRVAKLASEEWHEAGAVISRQGDEEEELYVVLHGEIEVVREGEQTWDVVYTARAGDFIGELAPLARLRRSATLRARENTTALMVRAPDLLRLIEEHPALTRGMLRVLARRLADRGPHDA
jgi:hypothetical protein